MKPALVVLRCCVVAFCCALFTPLAAMAAADVAAADQGTTASDEAYVVLDEVVVYGTDGNLVQGLAAESQLDEAGVAAYGANTIGDLLGLFSPDVDNTEEGPVILVNGKPANGIRSVNDLPSESVQSVQVLPPQAAAALGYEPTRRVINVVLKQSFRQQSANAMLTGATAGHGFSARADLGMLRLEGGNIRNLSLQATRNEPLLESHRGIVSQPVGLPYDVVGNVLSYPLPGGDIDPELSALAGYPVTVLGLPASTGDPTLDELLARANLANTSDLGRYRTLVADQYTWGLNASWGVQLPRRTALNLNVNATRSDSVSRTGAAPALLRVPAASPWSPFSRDVGIARYLGDPLRQHGEPTMMYLDANVNTQLGRWRVMVNSGLTWRESRTVSDRRYDIAALQAAIDDGTVNPFAPPPAHLLGAPLTDHAKSRGLQGNVLVQASGTLFKVPAGNATGSLRADVRRSRQRSRTVGTNDLYSRHSRADELAFASLQLPLIGGGTPQGFGLAAEINGSARDVNAVGTLLDHGYGLNWRLGNRITLRASMNTQKMAPQPEALTNPVVTIDDFRTYDFIRQETVLVRYITGGNPDLRTENRRITRVGGTLRPLAKLDLTFNGDYQRVTGRNATGPLPAVSEDVQAAFPDRYRRDAEGRLYEIDARLVSFARSDIEQLRWGGNFRRTLGRAPPGPPAPPGQITTMIYTDSSGMQTTSVNDSAELAGAGWRLSGNFTHTWQLANRRLAREGLPEQDLLGGGAGTGIGQSRHQLQSRWGLAYNGTGLQLNLNWKSATRITAGTAQDPNDIRFDPLLRVDLSAFSNLDMTFRGNEMLKGTRVTLSVENLFDAKQRVEDEDGVTPLRYQPYLLNALGRTVSLSLRKAF